MQIVVVAHNIRSTHNVGSILRTSDGFGVQKVYFSGYTPYPTQPNDVRPPHERIKTTRAIHKTALGAETSMRHEYFSDIKGLIGLLKNQGFAIIGLEQDASAVQLPVFAPKAQKIALVLGEEVNGIPTDVKNLCDVVVEIPMFGTKESFNVSVAAGIALYALACQVKV